MNNAPYFFLAETLKTILQNKGDTISQKKSFRQALTLFEELSTQESVLPFVQDAENIFASHSEEYRDGLLVFSETTGLLAQTFDKLGISQGENYTEILTEKVNGLLENFTAGTLSKNEAVLQEIHTTVKEVLQELEN